VDSSLLMVTRRGVAWFSRTRFFRRVGPTIMPPLERATRVVTGGRIQLSGVLVPSLVLHSTGAKTGIERDTPLMYCPEFEGSRSAGSMLVTGSNFARESHPAWTANLLAHPESAVSIRGRRMPVHAELIGDAEREAVWNTIERQWPGYRGYERASGRQLRIFRLTRRD
jgi:deazaflavin-dependent oxidoreductase (nitroreductase family)